jgi:Ni2+-binding GTPase involved in maturation of urease and hydrogenase
MSDKPLLIDGPPGAGKTSLKQALRDAEGKDVLIVVDTNLWDQFELERQRRGNSAIVIDLEDKIEAGTTRETDVLAQWDPMFRPAPEEVEAMAKSMVFPESAKSDDPERLD